MLSLDNPMSTKSTVCFMENVAIPRFSPVLIFWGGFEGAG